MPYRHRLGWLLGWGGVGWGEPHRHKGTHWMRALHVHHICAPPPSRGAWFVCRPTSAAITDKFGHCNSVSQIDAQRPGSAHLIDKLRQLSRPIQHMYMHFMVPVRVPVYCSINLLTDLNCVLLKFRWNFVMQFCGGKSSENSKDICIPSYLIYRNMSSGIIYRDIFIRGARGHCPPLNFDNPKRSKILYVTCGTIIRRVMVAAIDAKAR